MATQFKQPQQQQQQQLFKNKAKELGVVLSGVNLDKDEDDLFKLFKVEGDFALKTQLRDLVQREKQQQQQQQQQQNGKLRVCSRTVLYGRFPFGCDSISCIHG
jgi:hypothetical protein